MKLTPDMLKTIADLDLAENGESTAGSKRFKGDVVLPDGSKAYVNVYSAAPAKTAETVKERVAPKVRKGGESAPSAPAANPLGALANLSPEKLALLEKVLSQLGGKAS